MLPTAKVSYKVDYISEEDILEAAADPLIAELIMSLSTNFYQVSEQTYFCKTLIVSH